MAEFEVEEAQRQGKAWHILAIVSSLADWTRKGETDDVINKDKMWMALNIIPMSMDYPIGENGPMKDSELEHTRAKITWRTY